MLALLVPGVGMGGGGSPSPPAEVELEWQATAWGQGWAADGWAERWDEGAWAMEWQQTAWPQSWGATAWAARWSAEMSVIADINIHKGEAADLVFSPRDGAQDVSAWTLRLDVSRPVDLGGTGIPVLTLATGGSGVVGSILGVITASITRAQALLLSGRYLYTLTRSDVGKVLAEGRLTILPVARE